ncbi:ROK family protein [Paenibacillus sp. IB182496]|uniref:ROK family protein n=1 Tax=Paenibacillus sabuli TaxID=2772509 RepID=A0A927BWD7_9BACL|nr:ROK family protein [Paenibacillus sabuli]MBD2846965.1 ROK family protein [Paenibacillus sabuli]
MNRIKGRGPTLAKDMNRKQIYGELKRSALTTRAALAAALTLNKNTVNTIVEELRRAGYVRERGLLGSGGAGRKAVGIAFAADNRCAIGMQLQHASLRVVVTDLYAAPLVEFEQQVPGLDPEEVAQAIGRAATRAAAAAPAPIIGTALGLPGLLDEAASTVVASSHLGWQAVAFKTMAEQACRSAVLLDNSVKLATLGELWQGGGAGDAGAHFAYCSFGTGVGCGLILDGQIARGAAGSAGELGHIVVEPDGPRCSCGNRGCLEAVVGLPAVRARLALEMPVPDTLSGGWLAEEAARGNARAAQELERIGHAIAAALSALVNLLNPDEIICDGPLMEAAERLFPIIRREMEKRTLGYAMTRVRLSRSTLYPSAGAIGAAASVIANWERQADPLEPMTF